MSNYPQLRYHQTITFGTEHYDLVDPITVVNNSNSLDIDVNAYTNDERLSLYNDDRFDKETISLNRSLSSTTPAEIKNSLQTILNKLCSLITNSFITISLTLSIDKIQIVLDQTFALTNQKINHHKTNIRIQGETKQLAQCCSSIPTNWSDSILQIYHMINKK